MAKNISRSQYIKNLMEEKKALQEQMQELTNDTIKNMLGETVKNQINGILTEDENAFEEEEVVAQDGSEEDITDTTATEENGDGEISVDTEVDSESDDTESSEENETDMWNELEQFKGEDGEYDLTGMDKDEVIKVLKVMGPEDGVRVVKNDDGTIKLNDDETDKEYIIDINCSGSECEENGEEETFELEFDDNEDGGMEESTDHSCNEANLGYTDNYQKDTAMTTPDNHEPANPKSTYSMDKGVPTGTSKPWAGNGDKAPFDEKVNEGEEEEVVNETMTTQEQGPYNRGTGMVHTNTNSKAAKGRNAHAGGKQIHGTADNSYSEAQMESIKRMANEIFLENKQLKTILPQIKQQLQEAIVINQSLSNIVKVITENATSREEKQNILNRFKEVKTREESNKLYKTITEEFKRNNNSQNVGDIINSQLAESKNHIVESPMYQSEDLSETLQFMTRLNKIK